MTATSDRLKTGILLSLLVICAVLVLSGERDTVAQPEQGRLTQLPMDLGAWRGIDVPLENRVYEILETRDVVVRSYDKAVGGQTVWLSLVQAADNRAAFHPPEICYVGAAYTVIDKGRHVVTLSDGRVLEVNRLALTRGNEQVLNYYWFTAGNMTAASYFRQQARLAWDQLLGRGGSGTMVKLTTYVKAHDLSDADARLTEFLEDTLAEIEPVIG